MWYKWDAEKHHFSTVSVRVVSQMLRQFHCKVFDTQIHVRNPSTLNLICTLEYRA